MAEDWRSLLRGDLTVEPVSGHHDEMLDEPHVRDLARKLSAHLDNAGRRPAALAAAD
jgi:thioesterase domain-containing protein